jgi:hypothetical protein
MKGKGWTKRRVEKKTGMKESGITYEGPGRSPSGSISGPFLATSAKKGTRAVRKWKKWISFDRKNSTETKKRRGKQRTCRVSQIFSPYQLDPRPPSQLSLDLHDLDLLPSQPSMETQLLRHLRVPLDASGVYQQRTRSSEVVQRPFLHALSCGTGRRKRRQGGNEVMRRNPQHPLRLCRREVLQIRPRRPLPQLDVQSRPPLRFGDEFDLDLSFSRNGGGEELRSEVCDGLVRG